MIDFTPQLTGRVARQLDPEGMLYMWKKDEPVLSTMVGQYERCVALFTSKKKLEEAARVFDIPYETIKQVDSPEFVPDLWLRGIRLIVNPRKTEHGRVRYFELCPPLDEAPNE